MQPQEGSKPAASTPGAPASPASGEPRVVSDQDKALAGDWLKKITAAQKRFKDKFDSFETNRQLLAGKVSKGSKETVRANLHYANMAAMLPQVYAKDPEFSAKPTQAVPPDQMKAAKAFAATAEAMLTKVVVKDAKLKKAAKKAVRSCSPTSVGWIKASYQEQRGQDPLIANRLKDTQDNIAQLEMQLAKVKDPTAGHDMELQLAKLRETTAGLQTPQEVTIGKGIALDFVMSEDILIIDASIRSIDDYPRAGAIAHRVMMTPDQYQKTFGYKTEKGKTYTEKPGGTMDSTAPATEAQASLLCVYEVWDQDSNRIHYVCEGEEGFCKESSSPDWTGKRWYPFFLLAFNEIDGSFYPLSDIELADKLVKEYNESRSDFVRDREGCLPIKVVRKGGTLTPDDVKNLTNAKGGDTVVVEGVGGQPLTNDMYMGSLGTLNPQNYDTTASRYDMERVLGGSDTTTGSITKAKTLGEAELLTAAVRSRTGERQDSLEDTLNELGPYCLEVMLRKYSSDEVQKIAGPAASWPQLQLDEIFNLVSVEVRGGSTGKPDRLQEQDRWTKLLPIINEAVSKVSELRQQGQEGMAQAVIELVRETLRRFDERVDIEQFLPRPAEGEDDPNTLKQQLVQAKQQLQQMNEQYQDMKAKVERGYVSAAATIATSNDPRQALIAFMATLGQVDPAAIPPPAPPAPGAPGAMNPQPQPGQPVQQNANPADSLAAVPQP